MRYAVLGALCLVCAFRLSAQVPPGAADVRFDVASVKPNRTAVASMGQSATPGRFVATANLLSELILFAYPVEWTRVVAPEWVDRERFDINATTPETRKPGELSAMMRTLLAERFNMRAHWETRPMRVYVLSLARTDGTLGPGLRRSTVDCEKRDPPCSTRNMPRGTYRGIGSSWPAGILMGELRVAVGATVLDRTGLTGRFDIDMEWADPTAPVGDQAAVPDRPSLFTAVREQLGLKLEPGTEPMQVLVIDSIERPTPD